MIEVEVKYRVSDLKVLEDKLAKVAEVDLWRWLGEVDHYFNAPDRDFKVTDEALRVRTTTKGPYAFVTYKGPKLDTITKSRVEVEVPFSDEDGAVDDFINMLKLLRYRLAGTVTKARKIFILNRTNFEIQVSLDKVTNLGQFVELEIQAEEDQLVNARDTIFRTAAELGLTENERRSYLEMLLEEDSKVVLSEQEFADLLEYSSSLPTGTTVGKRWKRLQDNKWLMGEYVERGPAGQVGVQWKTIIVNNPRLKLTT